MATACGGAGFLGGNPVQMYRDRSRLLNVGADRFFDSPAFSDVTVVAPSGRKLRCHQLVLASCSHRFAGILEHGDFSGQDLPVQGVDSEALVLILRFFYSGDCPITLTTALPLFDAAVKLEVAGLSSACEQYVSQLTYPVTATIFLEQSIQLDLEKQVEVLLLYIRNRFDEVTQSDTFPACNYTTLLKLLLDNKHWQHEQAIFKAASKWLLSDGKRVEAADDVFRALGMASATVQSLLHQNAMSLIRPHLNGGSRNSIGAPEVHLGPRSTLGAPEVHLGLHQNSMLMFQPSGNGGPQRSFGEGALPMAEQDPSTCQPGSLSRLPQQGVSLLPNGVSLPPHLMQLQQQQHPPQLGCNQGPPGHTPMQAWKVEELAGRPRHFLQQQQQGLAGAVQQDSSAAVNQYSRTAVHHDSGGAIQQYSRAAGQQDSGAQQAGRLHSLIGHRMGGGSVDSMQSLLAAAGPGGGMGGLDNRQHMLVADGPGGGIGGLDNRQHMLAVAGPGSGMGGLENRQHMLAGAGPGGSMVGLDNSQHIFPAAAPGGGMGGMGGLNNMQHVLVAAAPVGNMGGLDRQHLLVAAGPGGGIGGIGGLDNTQHMLVAAAPGGGMGGLDNSRHIFPAAAPGGGMDNMQNMVVAGTDGGGTGALADKLFSSHLLPLGGGNGAGVGFAAGGAEDNNNGWQLGMKRSGGDLDMAPPADVAPPSKKANAEPGPEGGFAGTTAGGERSTHQQMYNLGEDVPPTSRIAGASAVLVPLPASLRGVCHVEGCFADLGTLREYHQRFKICDYHLKVGSIMREGVDQRFCQQCGRFHLLTEFDGTKRSCRARLQRHNARRRKKAAEASEAAEGGHEDSMYGVSVSGMDDHGDESQPNTSAVASPQEGLIQQTVDSTPFREGGLLNNDAGPSMLQRQQRQQWQQRQQQHTLQHPPPSSTTHSSTLLHAAAAPFSTPPSYMQQQQYNPQQQQQQQQYPQQHGHQLLHHHHHRYHNSNNNNGGGGGGNMNHSNTYLKLPSSMYTPGGLMGREGSAGVGGSGGGSGGGIGSMVEASLHQQRQQQQHQSVSQSQTQQGVQTGGLAGIHGQSGEAIVAVTGGLVTAMVSNGGDMAPALASAAAVAAAAGLTGLSRNEHTNSGGIGPDSEGAGVGDDDDDADEDEGDDEEDGDEYDDDDSVEAPNSDLAHAQK